MSQPLSSIWKKKVLFILFRKLKNFFSRSSLEQTLFFESIWHLAFIKILLLRYPFNAVAKRYDLELLISQEPKSNQDMKTLKQIRWAISRASTIIPWRSVCLDQALSAQQMLASREIRGILYMGVSKEDDPNKNKALKAHAWLKCGDFFVTGERGHEKFIVLVGLAW